MVFNSEVNGKIEKIGTCPNLREALVVVHQEIENYGKQEVVEEEFKNIKPSDRIKEFYQFPETVQKPTEDDQKSSQE